MYKIAGFFHPEGVYLNNRAYFQERLNAMGDSLKKNRKGQTRLWLSSAFAFQKPGRRSQKPQAALSQKPLVQALWPWLSAENFTIPTSFGQN